MPGATLLLLLLPPAAGGSGSTGNAGPAQVVAPFGWAFFFPGAAVPADAASLDLDPFAARVATQPGADDLDPRGVRFTHA